MGNAVSTPESMKNIPSTLNKDEYLQMTYNGNVYCIQKRSVSDQISGSFKQNFAMDALGLGAFNNINKQNTGHFYITLNTPSNEPIRQQLMRRMYLGLLKHLHLKKILN